VKEAYKQEIKQANDTSVYDSFNSSTNTFMSDLSLRDSEHFQEYENNQIDFEPQNHSHQVGYNSFGSRFRNCYFCRRAGHLQAQCRDRLRWYNGNFRGDGHFNYSGWVNNRCFYDDDRRYFTFTNNDQSDDEFDNQW